MSSKESKQVHHHSIHLSAEVQAIVDARRGERSINSYIVHCIETEKALAEACVSCHDREIAESVQKTIELVAKKAKGQ